jgi:hypothetical protein
VAKTKLKKIMERKVMLVILATQEVELRRITV